MSARVLSSLTEDGHPDLQKQIGCMNGLFQLFDRHHFLTGRRPHGQNHKRLLPGATHKTEPKCIMPSPMEKTPSEVVKGKDSLASESSKAPSWSSSSPSILEQNKRAQQESPSSQSNLPEASSQIMPSKLSSSSSHSGRYSSDLRDVVKDSMYREARSVSVKTVTKVEGRVHVMKHVDSPRPFQQSNCRKPSDGTMHVNGKFREPPRNSKEDKVGFLQHAPKDHPRFSYDERDSRETMRSSMKLKELPRLSLDSRQQSFRNSASESRSNFLLGDLSRENENSIRIPNTNKELQCHNRSSSVVAKLMGLEAFPNAVPSNEIETVRPKSFSSEDSISTSTKTTENSKNNQVTRSPMILEKDHVSPRMKFTNASMRTVSSVEPAPWRQPEANRNSHKSPVRNKDAEAPIKTPQLSSSVYGEIEKRITELEFRKSGKDLRALKQILEAMQKTRARLECQSTEQADSEANLEIVQQCNLLSPTIKGTPPPKRGDTTADKQTLKDMTPRAKSVRDSGWRLPSPDKKIKGGTSKAVQNPTLRQQKEGNYNPSLGRSSGTVSPRLQQKKHGVHDQSCPTITPSEFSRVRRHSIKQSKESGSSTRRQKAKHGNLPQGDDQLSEISSDTRNFSEQGDTASVQSESNSLASHAEAEVTSRNRSFDVNVKRQEHAKDKRNMVRLNEDTPMAELAIATIEQPSPVSVLDATFYIEDSPSPVKKKKIATTFRDEDATFSDVWYLDEQDHPPYSTRVDLDTGTNHNKLERISDLVHKLTLLDSTNHEADTDHLQSFSQNHNPDHRYITKILLASGLLKDVDSIYTAIQLHSSSHLINPKLFHILEQIEESFVLENDYSKKSARIKLDQKIHRKIIFDTVNELLIRKLASESCLMQGRKCFSAQQLLKELKSDIDHLNAKKVSMDSEDDALISILDADMRHQSEDWANYHGETPALVVDVERLIYKDLISEIISDEIREQQIRPRRHRRQLFTK